MTRSQAALAIAALAISPTVAFAQALPTEWSARYAGPLLLLGVLALYAVGAGLALPGLSRAGVGLWLLVMTAGGSLAVFTLQGAIMGERWQLASLLVGFLGFVFVGQWALSRLNRVKSELSRGEP
jgi:hypothetical protein